MNKFWLIIVPVLALLITACGEDGSYWSANTKQMESDAVGRLEAQGNDIRIYEFTPQTDPSVQCIFVAATSKAGLTCWKKGS
jgi:hypothetical protein